MKHIAPVANRASTVNVTESWLQEHDPDALLCWEKEVFARLQKEQDHTEDCKEFQEQLNETADESREEAWNVFVHKSLPGTFDIELANAFAEAGRKVEEKPKGTPIQFVDSQIRLARAEFLYRDVYPYVYNAEALACCLEHEAKELEWKGYQNMDPWYRASVVEQVMQETFEHLEGKEIQVVVSESAKWQTPWAKMGTKRVSWMRTKLDRLHAGEISEFFSLGNEFKGLMVSLLTAAFCEYVLLREEIRRKQSSDSSVAEPSLIFSFDDKTAFDSDVFNTINQLFCQYNNPVTMDGIVKDLPEVKGKRRFRIQDEVRLRVSQTATRQAPVDSKLPLTDAQLAIRRGGGQFNAAKIAMRAFLESHDSNTARPRNVLQAFQAKIRREKKMERDDGKPHPFLDKYDLFSIDEGLTAILQVQPDGLLAVETDRLADTIQNADRRKAKKPDATRR